VAFPLILLVGGAAAAAVAVAASSPAPSPASRPLDAAVGDLAARMARWGYRWGEGVEKFADPRLVYCFGYAKPAQLAGRPIHGVYSVHCPDVMYAHVMREKGSPPRGRPDFLTSGLDYLDASPPTARGRVAAIRRRVEVNGAIGEGSPGGSIVDALAKTSVKTMRAAAIELQGKLNDPKGRIAIAESLGIPVSKMVDAEAAFEAAIVKGIRDTARIDVSSLFRDLRAWGGGQLQAALSSMTRLLSGAFSGAGATASQLTDALSVGGLSTGLGIAGPLFKAAISSAIEDMQKADAAAQAQCRANNDAWLYKPLSETVSDGFPIPWNILAIYDVGCEKEDRFSMSIGAYPDDPNTARNDARLALLQSEDIGAGRAALELKRAWTQIMLVAGDPRMVRVLRALGRQRGLWASDEHVIIVGTAVAIAFDLDPWAFCEQLWGYSFGWSQYKDLGRPGVGPRATRSEDCLEGYVKGTGSSPDTPGHQRIPCGSQPYNAWSMSLAAIAACAFKLAEEVQGKSLPSAAGQLDLRAIMTR